MPKIAMPGSQPKALTAASANVDMLATGPDAVYWSSYFGSSVGKYTHATAKWENLATTESFALGITHRTGVLFWARYVANGPLRAMQTEAPFWARSPARPGYRRPSSEGGATPSCASEAANLSATASSAASSRVPAR